MVVTCLDLSLGLWARNGCSLWCLWSVRFHECPLRSLIASAANKLHGLKQIIFLDPNHHFIKAFAIRKRIVSGWLLVPSDKSMYSLDFKTYYLRWSHFSHRQQSRTSKIHHDRLGNVGTVGIHNIYPRQILLNTLSDHEPKCRCTLADETW